MLLQLRERIRAWIAQRDDHHYLGRYSITKLQHFDAYQRTASRSRVIAVILFTPIPTFLALMALDVVPMNHPSAGPHQNATAFIRSAISHAAMTFVTLLPLKQALSLSHRRYSFSTVARIACCTALTVEAVFIPLAFTWRFPVPFREILALPIWTTAVCWYNYVFARRTIVRLWKRHRLQLYVPIVGVQVVVLYVFLGLSVGFAYLQLAAQTAMILTFPLVKIGLRNIVWKYARELDDISTDVSICMLEVSGSLYQTVCLQFVTSSALSVLIMVSDFVQAVHEVRVYMKMDYLGDGRRTLATAMAIVECATQPDEASDDGEGTAPMVKGSPIVQAFVSHDERPPVNDEETIANANCVTTEAVPRPGSSEAVRTKPIIRRASIESLRATLFHRQGSMESLRSLFFTRQSSWGSMRSARQADASRPRLELRGYSVYLHPTNVRRVATSRRPRSTRRLLDLNRVSSNPPPPRPTSACAADIQVDEPTARQSVAATAPRKSAPYVRWSQTTLYEWFLSLFRVRSLRSKRVYVASDDDLISKTPPHNGTTAETSPPHWTDTCDPKTLIGMTSPLESARYAQPTSVRTSEPHALPPTIFIDGIVIARRHQARMLEQTLQLLFVCEVLLFAEYMEVVIPVLYAFVLGGVWLTPNASYNIVVSAMTAEQVGQQVWSSLLYALLELASLLVMYYVMHRRYGVSAFYLLAFVLEKYWMTLQGKLVGAFIVVMNAVTVQQGALGV